MFLKQAFQTNAAHQFKDLLQLVSGAIDDQREYVGKVEDGKFPLKLLENLKTHVKVTMGKKKEILKA